MLVTKTYKEKRGNEMRNDEKQKKCNSLLKLFYL